MDGVEFLFNVFTILCVVWLLFKAVGWFANSRPNIGLPDNETLLYEELKAMTEKFNQSVLMNTELMLKLVEYQKKEALRDCWCGYPHMHSGIDCDLDPCPEYIYHGDDDDDQA